MATTRSGLKCDFATIRRPSGHSHRSNGRSVARTSISAELVAACSTCTSFRTRAECLQAGLRVDDPADQTRDPRAHVADALRNVRGLERAADEACDPVRGARDAANTAARCCPSASVTTPTVSAGAERSTIEGGLAWPSGFRQVPRRRRQDDGERRACRRRAVVDDDDRPVVGAEVRDERQSVPLKESR
jgi:hypothetical protein